MVAMLNSCDAVLAVSRFVADKFAALGVDPARLHALHIGTRFTEIVEGRRGELTPPPPFAAGSRPVRLAFMGYNNYYKGLPMLIESLEMIAPEYLSRIHLTVLALGGEVNEPELRAIEPRLAGLRLEFGYRQEDLPRMIGGCDLGLVTSVWWDNGPQTVMEFLACGVPVLGAELGGIPDFVREGDNGLLFRGNDRWDLSRRLVEIVREPGVLDRLRAGVRMPKGMAEHAAELEAVYAPRAGAPV
jgi:glycosyltransferase involved in cell wall biosynthesis